MENEFRIGDLKGMRRTLKEIVRGMERRIWKETVCCRVMETLSKTTNVYCNFRLEQRTSEVKAYGVPLG
jgi:hypothetical protein